MSLFKNHLDVLQTIMQSLFDEEEGDLVLLSYLVLLVDATSNRNAKRDFVLFRESKPKLIDIAELSESLRGELPPLSLSLSWDSAERIRKVAQAEQPGITAGDVLFEWAVSELVVFMPGFDKVSRWYFAAPFLQRGIWRRFENYPRFKDWLRRQIERPKVDRTVRNDSRSIERFLDDIWGDYLPPPTGLTLQWFQEITGDAIPYLSRHGRLRWRATKKLIREMSEE